LQSVRTHVITHLSEAKPNLQNHSNSQIRKNCSKTKSAKITAITKSVTPAPDQSQIKLCFRTQIHVNLHQPPDFPNPYSNTPAFEPMILTLMHFTGQGDLRGMYPSEGNPCHLLRRSVLENNTRKEGKPMQKHLKRLNGTVSNAIYEIALDEDGVGVVEIILILVVLISLVVIFKKQVTQIVKDILNKAASDAKGI
jgi:hypothetical protein